MIKLLSAFPSNMPVAVFLLGRELKMIQNFTTDPEILKTALQKAHSAESNVATQMDPQDDPNALSATIEQEPNIPDEVIKTVEQFEREVYASEIDTRVRDTLEALRTIARHVAGYPGRKNLLWISSSFPIAINPDMNLQFAGMRNYEEQMTEVAMALAEAKVAVYPMDPAGVQTQAMFQAGSQVRGNPMGGNGIRGQHSTGQQLQREDDSRFDSKQSMNELAEQTGGIVCVENNDLGDCMRKAVNDGSSFYEIAYYPDSGIWDGKFHKIVVKSKKSDVHLAYRNGYYAQAANDQKTSDRELQEVACNDLMTSTAVLIVAKQLPVDHAGKAKYFMGIDPGMVTFTPQPDGSSKLTLKVGICTFDKSGKPLQFMQQAIDSKLTDKQFAAIQAQHGVTDTILLEPAPSVATVRLVVDDLETGHMGSVNLPYGEMVANTSTTATPNATSAPAAQAPH
jgi:VWFA-related protein